MECTEGHPARHAIGKPAGIVRWAQPSDTSGCGIASGARNRSGFVGEGAATDVACISCNVEPGSCVRRKLLAG
jgi:hypothetical protein